MASTGATGADLFLRETLKLLHLITNVLKFSAPLLDIPSTTSFLNDTCSVAELAIGMLINPTEDSGEFFG